MFGVFIIVTTSFDLWSIIIALWVGVKVILLTPQISSLIADTLILFMSSTV